MAVKINPATGSIGTLFGLLIRVTKINFMKLSNLNLRLQAVAAAFGLMFLLPVNTNSNKTGNNSTTGQNCLEKNKEKKPTPNTRTIPNEG